MACADKIAKDIMNSCDSIPRAGYESVAWSINREDIDTITYDATVPNLVEAITLNSGTRSYTITAVKKEANAGFDLATGDDIPDSYQHYFSFKPYEGDAESVKNFDDMQDLVIIAELKGSKTEGCFIIMGLEKGLYKTSGTQRGNDNSGLSQYEFASLEGQGERYSRFVFWDTDYATTKALIEALKQLYGPVLNVTNCANDDYTTFINATPTGFDATANGTLVHRGGTADEIPMVNTKQYFVEFDLVLNSGTAPVYDMLSAFAGGSRTDEGPQLAVNGANEFTFTANWDGAGLLEFKNINTAADFEITNLSIREVL